MLKIVDVMAVLRSGEAGGRFVRGGDMCIEK